MPLTVGGIRSRTAMWPDAGKRGAGARRGGCFPCGGNGGGLCTTCSVGGRVAHGTWDDAVRSRDFRGDDERAPKERAAQIRGAGRGEDPVKHHPDGARRRKAPSLHDGARPPSQRWGSD
jgi:hypothetical protein